MSAVLGFRGSNSTVFSKGEPRIEIQGVNCCQHFL